MARSRPRARPKTKKRTKRARATRKRARPKEEVLLEEEKYTYEGTFKPKGDET